MLKVQEFLYSGKTLEDLSILYNIQCNICESLGVVALNYSNLSPMDNDIVKECRSLYLELDTWNIVCKSMDAFFENYDWQGQIAETQIDWSNAKLIEKLDGALVNIYFYKDQWRIGSKMSADGSEQVTAINGTPTDLTFAELTKLVIQEMGYTWEEYTKKLNRGIYFTLELCAPETRYGVIYNERRLVVTSMIDSYKLKNLDVYRVTYPKEKPNYFPVSNLAEVNNLVTQYSDPLKYEGFVLFDGTSRIKYKNPEYISMLSSPDSDNELHNVENLLEYVLSFSTGTGGGYSTPPPNYNECPYLNGGPIGAYGIRIPDECPFYTQIETVPGGCQHRYCTIYDQSPWTQRGYFCSGQTPSVSGSSISEPIIVPESSEEIPVIMLSTDTCNYLNNEEYGAGTYYCPYYQGFCPLRCDCKEDTPWEWGLLDIPQYCANAVKPLYIDNEWRINKQIVEPKPEPQRLHVQQYLREGHTLGDLSLIYNINCDVSEELGVAVLNYTSLSPMTNPLACECRGLLLELDTWNIVGKSMTIFFENFEPQGQIEETRINWNNAKLFEKLDGVLIIMYYYKDAWRIGMRLSADGSMKVSAINGVETDLTFAELTKQTIESMGYTWEQFVEKMEPQYTYSFELTAPETRYGVLYLDRKLTLIAITDNETFEEKDICEYKHGFSKDMLPVFYDVKNVNDVYDNILKYSDPLKYEGFVLFDGTTRIKYKNPEYVSLMSAPESEDDLKNIENLLEYVLSFSTGGSGGYSIPHAPDVVYADYQGWFYHDITFYRVTDKSYSGNYSGYAAYLGYSAATWTNSTLRPPVTPTGDIWYLRHPGTGGSSESYTSFGGGPCGEYWSYDSYVGWTKDFIVTAIS